MAAVQEHDQRRRVGRVGRRDDVADHLGQRGDVGQFDGLESVGPGRDAVAAADAGIVCQRGEERRSLVRRGHRGPVGLLVEDRAAEQNIDVGRGWPLR